MGPWCQSSYGKWLAFNFLWSVHQHLKVCPDSDCFVKRKGLEGGYEDARVVRIAASAWHEKSKHAGKTLRDELNTLVSDAEGAALVFGKKQTKDQKTQLDSLELRARALIDELCGVCKRISDSKM